MWLLEYGMGNKVVVMRRRRHCPHSNDDRGDQVPGRTAKLLQIDVRFNARLSDFQNPGESVPYLARFRQQKESARVVKVWRTFSWKKFALLSSWCVHETLMTSSHVGQ